MEDVKELSPTMKELYARMGIEYPQTTCRDVRNIVLAVGDSVFVARTTAGRGTVLDFGKIVKLDIKKQKVLIDWSESPVDKTCVCSNRHGGYDIFPRKKTWVWNHLCGKVS